MNNAVRDTLIATARARSLITYTDLGKVADLDVSESEKVTDLGRLLDEIAIEDVKAGRPLLAAVVVRADSQMPSEGLFKFARKHGLMRGNDKMAFWAAELTRVYEAVASVDG